jgi:hypothetical protein
MRIGITLKIKKKMKSIKLLSLSLAVALWSCGGGQKKAEDNKQDTAETIEEAKMEADSKLVQNGKTQEKNGITVYPAKIAKEFPNAKLNLTAPKAEEVKKAGKYTFKFAVADYELATQTEMAEMRNCANSKKGQHIHYILNNAPYEAHYEPSFSSELMEGNNVVLAFLSRSYHESIKNSTAYVLKNFKIGESANEFDKSAQHLFYSRPKGSYSGKDTEKILLDFYLINTKLSESGYKVKATIDGTEFMLSSWQPYFVEGLGEGEHAFRIQLLNAAEEVVPGPFNDSGERVISVKKDEA